MALTLLSPKPQRLDDTELVLRAREGEGLAFEALYRRHVHRVAAVVFRLLRRPADVEDVVQDAFSLAFRRLGQLAEPQAFGGWLLQIAVSQVHRRLRWQPFTRLFQTEAEAEATLATMASSEASPETRAQLSALDAKVQALPLPERTAWVLRFVLGCTLPEVAQGCGCSLACTDDDGCALGAWCISGTCQTCPKAECPACPSPFVPLARHGCATCDCGPASTCDGCAAPDTCLAGAYAVAGCSGTGCAVARCQDTSCASANPEGCATSCGAQSCQSCFASSCVCRQGGWACTPTCAPPELEPYVTRCKG